MPDPRPVQCSQAARPLPPTCGRSRPSRAAHRQFSSGSSQRSCRHARAWRCSAKPAGLTANEADATKSEIRAVNIAITSNILIFAAKLFVSQNSGSSALLSEAVHTLADIGNQLLLRLGIARSTLAPTSDHPYGYLKDKFIFSLISAVGVFCIGAGASLINGFHALNDVDHDVANFGLSFAVLAVSFVVEGFSCAVAVRTIAQGAERRGLTIPEYLDSGSDPAAVAVVAEDGAAVIGVVIAALATWLVKLTDCQLWDGLGSILVGILLACVALFLIQRNRAVLIGRSMQPADLAAVIQHLNKDSAVNHVYDARSEEIGPGVYRFSAELDFNGEVIAAGHLRHIDSAALLRKFVRTSNKNNPDDVRAFQIVLKEYGGQLVHAVGSEVDRIEAEIKRLVPGVKYVDLEADRGRFVQYRTTTSTEEALALRTFDLSQLSLDEVAWQRESDKIDFLLAAGRAKAASSSASGSSEASDSSGAEGAANTAWEALDGAAPLGEGDAADSVAPSASDSNRDDAEQPDVRAGVYTAGEKVLPALSGPLRIQPEALAEPLADPPVSLLVEIKVDGSFSSTVSERDPALGSPAETPSDAEEDGDSDQPSSLSRGTRLAAAAKVQPQVRHAIEQGEVAADAEGPVSEGGDGSRSRGSSDSQGNGDAKAGSADKRTVSSASPKQTANR